MDNQVVALLEHSQKYINGVMGNDLIKHLLDQPDAPKIKDSIMRESIALQLENTLKYHGNDNLEIFNQPDPSLVKESAPSTSGGSAISLGSAGLQANAISGINKAILPIARRFPTKIIAYDIVGVQTLVQNSQTIFALKSRLGNPAGLETLFDEVDTGFTGTGTKTGTNPVDGTAYTTGIAMDIALAERLGRKGSGDPEFAEMSFSIETTTVTAKSRGVKADISTEVLRELRNVHAVDGLGLLREIMENELVAETNRETVRKVYISAKNGSQQTTTANRFDLDVDANGRWFMEKFKGLVFHIKRECNIIHQETRTGPGNWIIVSADVAAALETTGLVSTDGVELNPNTCFFGTLVGGVKVYVDPYLNLSDQYQTMVVGRKGTSPWDAGLFYCPYVPIETFTIPYATNSFQPQVAMKSVYGMAYNPYIELDDGVAGTANMTPGINKYYRKSAIVNLM